MLTLIKRSQLEGCLTDGDNVICHVSAEVPDYEFTALSEIIKKYNELISEPAAGHSGMLKIKPGTYSEFQLLENERHLITFKDKGIAEYKRFKKLVDWHNYVSRETEQGRMVPMPAAVSDTVRRTGFGSNMTVLAHGLLVEIDGKPQWISAADYKTLVVECDKQEELARMNRLFGGTKL